MNIFIRNVPAHASDDDLARFFKPHLNNFGIDIYQCDKLGRKPFAILTIVDPGAGIKFLQKYGYQGHGAYTRLLYSGNLLNLVLNRNQPDRLKLDSIQRTHQKKMQQAQRAARSKGNQPLQTNFNFESLSNGCWTYHQDRLLLQPFYVHPAGGMALFGRRFLSLFLQAEGLENARRVDIAYHSVSRVVKPRAVEF
jgi:hypothetical protein